MRIVNELAHPLIFISYLTLALLSLFLRLPSPTETWMARIGGALFFLGCGLHHLGMLLSVANDEPILDTGVAFHTAASLMQVIGAPVFIIAVGPHVPQMLQVLRGRTHSTNA